jgi:beta-N-acetylhexosaminidase
MVNRSRLTAVIGLGALLLVTLPKWFSASGAVAVKKQSRQAQADAAATSKAARAASAKERNAIAQARRWMAKMTLRDRVAQLVMTPFYGDSPNMRSREFREFKSQVIDLKVGGLIVLNRVRDGAVQRAEPHATAAFINRMQRLAKTPLIVGADFEHGASMRMVRTTPFPYMMAFGAANDLEATRALGAATAREARAMGIHWIFAPDADVNNNPDNPIINIRSFGENPQAVAAHVKAFIEGAHCDPANFVLVTAKHFPGHGDTDTDTHMNLARVNASRERLEQVELVPFKAAIEAGVDSVMTGHLAVPALEPEEKPATVSSNILTGLLREELGFKGLICTDALDMQAVTKLYGSGETAVRALEAGVDLLLLPGDAKEAVRAVVAAVKDGRLTKARIDESVLKLLTAKARLGLQKKRLTDVEAVPDSLGTPEDEELAARVAEKAVTLVRNENNVVPLANPERACWFVLSGGRFSAQGRDLVDAARRSARGAQVTLLDPMLPTSEFDSLAAKAQSSCDAVVVSAYVLVAAYSGSTGLPGNYPAFVDKLITSNKPVVFIALGNPYLLRAFPKVAAYLATFSTTAPSEVAAVRAVVGETGISGKLPITIPGFAQIGDGLRTEAKPASR